MSSNASRPSAVVKRNGSVAPFQADKITHAILGALRETDAGDLEAARDLTATVLDELKRLDRDSVEVEEIQDIVERVLIRADREDTAKAYILHRQRHADLRRTKAVFGVADDLKLTLGAVKILQKRYLLRDESGRVVETPRELFRRVARAVAKVDEDHGETSGAEEVFFGMLSRLEFLPNSPTLMNAGTGLGQLSACFVLPVGDSVREIFDAVKHMAIIHQSGGGTGFDFSRLRPRDDVVRSTGGIASGPVSFMKVFDQTTEVIRQGGRRRGANMAVLRVDHPDVFDFIAAKTEGSALSNFNISVAVTDAFLEALADDADYPLINPRTGNTVRRVPASEVFNLIVHAAWQTGDPGLLFIDEINRRQPTPEVGPIEATNPCGEQPLLPWESCNLGSVNMVKMLTDGRLDWDKLERTVRDAVHFLDNVIDAGRFPLDEITRATRANRKIGLGIMGWADMLLEMGIRYDTEEALDLARRVMRFITDNARDASAALGARRGSFPNFERSIHRKHFEHLRNATCTTIAPTGTIGLVAGVSSGIEPLFALSYFRTVVGGTVLLEENPVFKRVAHERGFYSEALVGEIARTGSVREVTEIPEDVRGLFVTAMDIAPEWHVRMQAAFQEFTDNAVSKTINLPADATPEDVRRAVLLAGELGCKGITVYRYGTVRGQPLSLRGDASRRSAEPGFLLVDEEYDGKCRRCEH